MIKNFKPRLYQETIFGNANLKNTLIVLPTGLGKTNIFLMLAAQRLKQFPNSKIVLLGPTRPLIEQYKDVFKKNLEIEEDKMQVFTGHVSPQKRKEKWDNAKIIFSTPQGLENDIISNRISIKNVSLIGFDEAHRAVGDYSYVYIAKKYNEYANYPRIVGMTASPGSESEKIEEVIKNLYIEDIQVRSDESGDVREYIKEVKTRWIEIEFPNEFKKLHKYLTNCLASKIETINQFGTLGNISKNPSRKELLDLQASLQGEMAQGNKDFGVLKSLSLAAEAMKVQHALELIETQTLQSLNTYLEDINRQSYTTKTKAVQNLAKDENFKSAIVVARKLIQFEKEHPKIKKLKEILRENLSIPGYKIIVFSQYRDTGKQLVEELNSLKEIKAELFIGQAKKKNTGYTQKEQIEILNKFREGEFNVLVSSSVGEEGLDVPQVDLVVFYEPIPSAIRQIQRKGRTGRQEKGEVIVLYTKGTIDEAYRWSAQHKEKRMYRLLENVKNKLAFKSYEKKVIKQKKEKQDFVIYADYREKGNRVLKELDNNGVKLKLEKLEHGDYLLSSRCAVEFKTIEDFVDSLIDGRLMEQVKDLKSIYEKPVVVVEGNQDIYSVRNVNPNAIRGMIAAITVSFGVPVLYTKSKNDTAQMLISIAAREQDITEKDFSRHPQKSTSSTKEMQEYLVSAIPGVGPGLAKNMLREFGSVEQIINAKAEELQKVESIGKIKAKKIREIVESKYN